MIREPNMIVVLDNAEYRIGALQEALMQDTRVDRAVELLYETSRARRMAAVASLLANADPSAFRQHLSSSGGARVALLERAVGADRHPNFRSCASVAAPLFDALAADQIPTAKNIAVKSPTTFVEEAEYAEDFHFVQILHGLLKSDFGPIPESSLADFEAAGSSTRLGLCAALKTRVQADFEAAFETILEERSAYFEGKEGSLVHDQQWHAIEKYVFVEGLALLQVAMTLGLETAHIKADCLPDLVR